MHPTTTTALDRQEGDIRPGLQASLGARSLRREDGFTMVELLVTIIFIGVMFAAFSALMGSTVTNSSEITNESVLQSQVRATVNQLTSELRQAYPVSTTATSPFATGSTTPSATTMTFYSPDRSYSSSSPTAFHLREISYQLSGTNFQRAFATGTATSGPSWGIPGTLSSWVTENTNVTNTDIFTYYDSSGAVISSPATNASSIATVVVKLTVTTPTGKQKAFTYSDGATLRVSE